jgi:hypothetical protein
MAVTEQRSRKEQLRGKRALTCVTPSGVEVVVRPVNLQMHALRGGLPAGLRAVASRVADRPESVDEIIRSGEGDVEMRAYLDGIVSAFFLDPEFDAPVYQLEDKVNEESGETEIEAGTQIGGDKLDEFLLPVDYAWAIAVCMGILDEDGEGRRLWGVPSLDEFAPFREEHGCDSTCEACYRAQRRLAVRGYGEGALPRPTPASPDNRGNGGEVPQR